jgi:hypothetical protein
MHIKTCIFLFMYIKILTHTHILIILNQFTGPAVDLDTLQNSKYCDKCYCYVCDKIVKECTEWRGHCHASHTNSKWKEMRDAKKVCICVCRSIYVCRCIYICIYIYIYIYM